VPSQDTSHKVHLREPVYTERRLAIGSGTASAFVQEGYVSQPIGAAGA
jgi:hypothetical protein